jgi:hypothetical protein
MELFRVAEHVIGSDVDGNEWNKKDVSVLVYILRNLCSSKFSLSSFLDISRESFRFAQTGYQRVLREFEVVEDVALDLYRTMVVPLIKKVTCGFENFHFLKAVVNNSFITLIDYGLVVGDDRLQQVGRTLFLEHGQL